VVLCLNAIIIAVNGEEKGKTQKENENFTALGY
jgi:hypothetical protein